MSYGIHGSIVASPAAWNGPVSRVASIMPPAWERSPEASRSHAKSASRHPAILNPESRYVEVKCPLT